MKRIILIIVPILFLSACKTLVPFTQELKKENHWKEADLKKIQFYLSNSIILHRQLSNTETAIESGKIKIRNGKKVEEIIIKKGTPGVLVADKGILGFRLSFEKDDNHVLTFGWFNGKGKNYYLKVNDFKKNKYYKVDYNGKTYFTNYASLQSFLMVDIKKLLKEERKQRVAGGRKL